MSTPAETPAKAPIVEGPGRYVVFQAPDNGWVVARAVDLCERCLGCGCGEQAELIQIPGLVIQLAMRQGKDKILGMLKGGKKRG